MELNERDLNNEIREKKNLEGRTEAMRQEIVVLTDKMKVCSKNDLLVAYRTDFVEETGYEYLGSPSSD
jgi:hypothetical protein